MPDTPLYRMDPSTRFSSRAEDYARSRPSYPAEAIDWILSRPSEPQVADLGAGTGISARLMADRDARVLAFEPNLSMIAAALGHAGVSFVAAPAESLPIRTGRVDLITAFQAFHWFDPDRALPEMARVLRDDGVLCLVWNDWHLEDPWTRDYAALVRKASRNHPAEDRLKEVAPLFRSPLFGKISERVFACQHRLDFEGLQARVRSTSYLPRDGEPYEAMIHELRTLVDQHANSDGTVTHCYDTHVFRASKAIGPRPEEGPRPEAQGPRG